MLDQGFNQRNFRRIYDAENRKGANLEERFCLVSEEFAELKQQTITIKNLKIELKDSISHQRVERTEETADAVNIAATALREAADGKERYLNDHLEDLANSIARDGHNLTLTPHAIPGGKTLFLSNNDPATFFIEKQIQHNISRLYKISPGNKDVIVPQVMSFCGGKFPFWGLRTDISDFYETIDHRKLLKLLKSDQLLDAPSIRYIQQVLFAYSHATGSAVGLPRGNGISAYLAELFMRPIDTAVKSLGDVLYYARYVDDIFILCAQSPEWKTVDRLADITASVQSHGLALNPTKTIEFSNTDPTKARFNYLGYEFKIANGQCEVDISAEKRNRYRNRINKCFDIYMRAPARKKHNAGETLLRRIIYLTSNTKLHNNKSNAYIGVYYSNRHVNKPARFKDLDAALNYKISLVGNLRLQARLMRCSFELGYGEQRFTYFKQAELINIVRIWKYE
ncbi:antiviral reverse transcriptase Drt3a [Rhizobium tubonense]|uniref:antiviral reverse transcriptase Drt3a n=1 Tax=Rhizobium tubonense TaxID=484088 RepID=UPI0011B399D8|nr:antiviral reverse transcriptase Drt3a [Rhizobium tubonense]